MAQNAYVERFNRTARHEWLNMHMFESVEHAQELATQWLWLYNNERPSAYTLCGIRCFLAINRSLYR